MAYRRVTAEGAAYAHDADLRRRVDGALAFAHEQPTAALADLGGHASGIDRLIRSWSEAGEAPAAGPAGRDREFLHDRVMILHGQPADEDPAKAGAAGRASAKPLAAHRPGGAPLPADEAEAAVAEIRRAVASNLERLRGMRERAADPEETRRRMIEAAMVDETPGALLRFRYEMQIERSVRSTINQLMELHRTGADLAEADPGPAPAVAPSSGATGGPGHQCSAAPDSGGKTRPEPPSSPQGHSSSPLAPPSGSFGAGVQPSSRRRPDPQKRAREDRRKAARQRRKGGSQP